jgi:uncharacterized protein (DUF1800 family)
MSNRLRLSVLAVLALIPAAAAAGPTCDGPPAEVTGVEVSAPSTLEWEVEPCSARYNVYRGGLAGLLAGQPVRCHAHLLSPTSFPTPADPEPGEGYVYLVTGVGISESTPGFATGGAERALAGSCEEATDAHVLNRTGFGWGEWSSDRIETLGPAAYITEQLDPELIDEGSNLELAAALAPIDPPIVIQELTGIQMVRSVYGRRQLEQAATMFWTNHFNTEFIKTFQHFFFLNPDTARRRLEASTLHYRESEDFRRIAFQGSFRQLLDVSAYSPAMIIYLDTKNSIAGNPNENYARELLELHTMGVDGGYTETDIAELSRVFTGWNVCKKFTILANQPLANCILEFLIGTPDEPEGLWVANFRPNQHDCGSKVLFQGTPQEVTIPATCDAPQDGVNDAALALDAIAAHPSTARFISTKLLQKFVTDTPSEAMIDDIVAVWNDPGAVGDLHAVLSAVLAQTRFLDPDIFRVKIKTPFEQMASIFRASRGNTNGTTQIRTYLERMDHLPFENPVPTGYPEDGPSWLDTNNHLERQNLGEDITDSGSSTFGSDVITLLQDNGIPLGPGNAALIVDFLSGVMFGGAISPVERQAAIDFLQSDDAGTPDPNYDDTRIRQTVGYMLGYAQFQEQ